ncbi:conserved hypothetical protein [Paraburkholderia caribensis]|nr:conserved hypothetical protein [Paraburkholderia caribensis]
MVSVDVPEDFPRDATPAVVSGSQPKVCAWLSKGRYLTGHANDERRERWLLCEDLASQLVRVAQKDALAHPEQSRPQTLERIQASVRRKGWVSPEELAWLVPRLQQLLDWY